MYVCVYIYIYIYVCAYMCIYIYMLARPRLAHHPVHLGGRAGGLRPDAEGIPYVIHICYNVYIYIYTYIYICVNNNDNDNNNDNNNYNDNNNNNNNNNDDYQHIYIYIYILSSSRKPSGHYFMVSAVDIIQRSFMVSVVGFLLWFP